jgi:hypothetical protein
MTITITQDMLSPSPLLGVSSMDFFFYLLVAYGIAFGMQHKAPFLRGKSAWLDRMLVCTYCTGFHAGWITWFGWKLKMIFENPMNVTGITFIEMILFAMGSSAFSYFFDTAIRLMETHADPIEVEEEIEEIEETEAEEDE